MGQVRAQDVLKAVFGFESFRGPQEAVIDAVVLGKSALLLMPTGMGKSLCYQIPARMSAGLTLVITPLIALMKDQVDAALKRKFRACFINSSLRHEERQNRYARLAAGEFELVYVTPERFRNADFMAALRKNKVSLLAVDEAHCISAWGHDFRPDYSRLGEYRALLGDPPTLALTATATPETQADILSSLKLAPETTVIFNHGLDRPNLGVRIHLVHGLDEKIRRFTVDRHQTPGPVIVYFSLIQTLQKFSEQLRRLSLNHLIYHGQMNDKDRKRTQEKFLESADAVILATPAFGLGIDKPNVRMVVHAEVPGSVESYYQEIGRAGRDGQPSECVCLYDPDDVSIQMDFIKWAHPDPGFIQAVYNLLERNLTRARQEGLDYLRAQMNFYNRRDFRLETALNLLERWGSITGLQPVDWNVVSPPPAEFMDQKTHAVFLRNQQKKLLQVVQLTKTNRCRMQQIHGYFGLSESAACGVCDVCGGEFEGSNTEPL